MGVGRLLPMGSCHGAERLGSSLNTAGKWELRAKEQVRVSGWKITERRQRRHPG